eukprot:TRINITY_DN534_c0_g1_i2.p1 TRINITY_DN534_c0_g1~~TRINITY_DN534_c0_g1_i2.p1  ORF type:complete len:529 (+),score=153.74 TRINITY_DN534_c0_g1_i2:127-1713(+)
MEHTNYSNLSVEIQLVEKATSEYLLQPDWEVVLQLCDHLNKYPEGAMNVSKLVAKRMDPKKPRMSMFALELAEALMKNCECIHRYIGAKEFQAELIKLVQNKKTKDDVKEKALELVQFWGDSFALREDVPLFVRTYQILRRNGLTFPPRRPDEELLVSTNRRFDHGRQVQTLSVSDRIQSTATRSTNRPRGDSAGTARIPRNENSSSDLRNQATNTNTNNSSSAKKETTDFVALRETLSLTLELLSFCDPEQEDPASNDILNDMLQNCKESQATLKNSIENGNFSSDEQMMSLISLNEELLKAQDMYNDLVSRRSNFLKSGPTQQPPAQQSSASVDLIDLSDAFRGISVQPPSTTPSSSHPPAGPNPYGHSAPYYPPPTQAAPYSHLPGDYFLPPTTIAQPTSTTPPPHHYGPNAGVPGPSYGGNAPPYGEFNSLASGTTRPGATTPPPLSSTPPSTYHTTTSYPPPSASFNPSASSHPAASNTDLDYAQYLASFNNPTTGQANINTTIAGQANASSSHPPAANYGVQ